MGIFRKKNDIRIVRVGDVIVLGTKLYRVDYDKVVGLKVYRVKENE